MRDACWNLREGEVLIWSTEVLESLLGKWKSVWHQESKSGITSNLLSIGALVGEWPEERILEALTATPTKSVEYWNSKHLPPSVQTQRRTAFSPPENCKQNTPDRSD